MLLMCCWMSDGRKGSYVAHVLLDIGWFNVAYVLLGDRWQEGGEPHEAGV